MVDLHLKSLDGHPPIQISNFVLSSLEHSIGVVESSMEMAMVNEDLNGDYNERFPTKDLQRKVSNERSPMNLNDESPLYTLQRAFRSDFFWRFLPVLQWRESSQ